MQRETFVAREANKRDRDEAPPNWELTHAEHGCAAGDRQPESGADLTRR